MSITEIIPAVRLSGVRNSNLRNCCLQILPQRNCQRCSRKDRFSRSTHQSTPLMPRPNWPSSLGGRDSLMSVVEQFPYCDRNPASGGLDLMPDLPIVLRHQSHSLSGVGLVDSGAPQCVALFAWRSTWVGLENTKGANHTCWNSGACRCPRDRSRGGGWATVAHTPGVGLGRFGSGSLFARTVQLLPGVRCLLFPHAGGLRDQATRRLEFSVSRFAGIILRAECRSCHLIRTTAGICQRSNWTILHFPAFTKCGCGRNGAIGGAHTTNPANSCRSRLSTRLLARSTEFSDRPSSPATRAAGSPPRTCRRNAARSPGRNRPGPGAAATRRHARRVRGPTVDSARCRVTPVRRASAESRCRRWRMGGAAGRGSNRACGGRGWSAARPETPPGPRRSKPPTSRKTTSSTS